MAFRLVNRDRLMKPGKCLICETKPAHRVVDTGFNLLAATVFDKLRGRKYVCEACGEKIGKAFGMAVAAKVNSMKEEIIRLQNRVEELAIQQDLASKVDDLYRAMHPATHPEARDEVAEVPKS